MESKKVKITLPRNCEVESVNAKVDSGCIIVEYTPKEKYEPKDGDVLYCLYHGIDWIMIFNYKDTLGPKPRLEYNKYYALLGDDNSISLDGVCFGGLADSWSLATEEQKQKLFRAMKENGFRWNPELKMVEKVRWRAIEGKNYYCISSNGDILRPSERHTTLSDDLWACGNYFRTEEEAKLYLEKIKNILLDREND